MKSVLLISAFGVLGVVSRHLLENRLGHKSDLIPLGTLSANILGCFLAGFVYQIMTTKMSHQELASIILVGFCGGLTTFSGYALSSLNDIQNGEFGKAALYLVLSPAVGIASAFLGMKLFKVFL